MNAISEVYNMDCMDYMRGLPDKFFELAICDVEYGIGVGKMSFLSEVNTTVKQKNGSRLNGNGRKTPYQKKEWDSRPPTQEYFDELKRVSVHQIVFGVDYTNWIGTGTGRIKWDKGVAEGVSFKRYETALCSLIDREIELPLLWAGMCQAKSLSEPMTQQGNKRLNEKRIHPCHKPILLYRALLTMFAKPGWTLFDSHLGGGSHRIAAYKMGFDFYATELDKDYFEAQEKRFKEAIAMPLFDNIQRVDQIKML